MKKLLPCLLALLLLCACGKEVYRLEFTIPPGDGTEFVWSDQQLIPNDQAVKISAGAGVTCTVQVKLVDAQNTLYGPFEITREEPLHRYFPPDVSYYIAVAASNDASGPIALELEVENAELSIE